MSVGNIAIGVGAAAGGAAAMHAFATIGDDLDSPDEIGMLAVPVGVGMIGGLIPALEAGPKGFIGYGGATAGAIAYMGARALTMD